MGFSHCNCFPPYFKSAKTRMLSFLFQRYRPRLSPILVPTGFPAPPVAILQRVLLFPAFVQAQHFYLKPGSMYHEKVAALPLQNMPYGTSTSLLKSHIGNIPLAPHSIGFYSSISKMTIFVLQHVFLLSIPNQKWLC